MAVRSLTYKYTKGNLSARALLEIEQRDAAEERERKLDAFARREFPKLTLRKGEKLLPLNAFHRTGDPIVQLIKTEGAYYLAGNIDFVYNGKMVQEMPIEDKKVVDYIISSGGINPKLDFGKQVIEKHAKQLRKGGAKK